MIARRRNRPGDVASQIMPAGDAADNWQKDCYSCGDGASRPGPWHLLYRHQGRARDRRLEHEVHRETIAVAGVRDGVTQAGRRGIVSHNSGAIRRVLMVFIIPDGGSVIHAAAGTNVIRSVGARVTCLAAPDLNELHISVYISTKDLEFDSRRHICSVEITTAEVQPCPRLSEISIRSNCTRHRDR